MELNLLRMKELNVIVAQLETASFFFFAKRGKDREYSGTGFLKKRNSDAPRKIESLIFSL